MRSAQEEYSLLLLLCVEWEKDGMGLGIDRGSDLDPSPLASWKNVFLFLIHIQRSIFVFSNRA